MRLTVAGEKKDYEDGISVQELIEREQVENAEYVVVSVNDEFVRSEDFSGTTLKDGDEVEFLYFMGGGAR